MQLPPGYQPHTDPQYAATYMWNPTTGDVRPIEYVQPAPAPAPVPAAQAVPQYGTVDLDAVSQDQGHVFQHREKKYFIDVPTPTSVGMTNSRIVRLLPPWQPNLTIPYVKFAVHRLPAAFVPNPGDRKWFFYTCYDTDGGPQNCPVCAARKAVLERDADNASVDALGPRGQYVWQALDLENLNAHMHQRIDHATQQPMIGPDGRPVYDLVPGILKSGAQLWKAIVAFFREKGDATHIETGYALKVMKTKEGPMDMNVKWSAMDQAPSRLDDHLRPVLANLFDLQADFVQYRSAEEMQGVAEMIQRAGEAPQPVLYQPPAAYGAQPVQPFATPPAAPPLAPMAAQPAPVAPQPPAPQPPAPQPPAPQPPAPQLPPVQAPGGIPGAPAGLQPPRGATPMAEVPPTPPPAPGLPGGFTAPVAAPAPMPPAPAPENGAALGQALSPEEFEAQERASQAGKPPF